MKKKIDCYRVTKNEESTSVSDNDFDKLLKKLQRVDASISNLLSVFRIPGDGTLESDISLTRLDRLARALNAIGSMFLPMEPDDSETSESEKEMFSRQISLKEIHRLKGLLAHANDGTTKKTTEFLEFLCATTLDVFDMTGTEHPTLGDVRLVTAVSAMGASWDGRSIGREYVFDMLGEIQRVLTARFNHHEVATSQVAAYVLGMVFENCLHIGGIDMGAINDKFRAASKLPDQDDVLTAGYYNALSKAGFFTRFFTKCALSGIANHDAEKMREYIPGAGMIFLLSGGVPSSPDFWLHFDLFNDSVNSVFDESFPATIAANEILTHAKNTYPEFCESYMLQFLRTLMEEYLISFQAAESATLIHDSLAGWFDASTAHGTPSSWTRHTIVPSETRIVSPLSAPGFLERLDEWAEQNKCGNFFRECFVLDALDVFSVSKFGCDMTHFVDNRGKPENDVLTGEFIEWLDARLEEILRKCVSDTNLASRLFVPCIPSVVSTIDSFNGPRLLSLTELIDKSRGLSFRDSVATLVVAREIPDILDAYMDMGGVAVERIVSMFRSVAEAVGRGPDECNLSEDPRTGRGLLENAVKLLKESVEVFAEHAFERLGVVDKVIENIELGFAKGMKFALARGENAETYDNARRMVKEIAEAFFTEKRGLEI